MIRRGGILLVAACLAACYDREAGPTETSRDSAGVLLVESDPRTAETWGVGADPVTEIGGVSDAPGHELFEVVDAAILPNGDVAVADAGASEIRVFDAAGALLRTIGGEGEGPGEFQGLSSIQLRGDSIVAVDGRSLRITVFTPDGTVARETAETHPYVGMLGDGSPISIGYHFRNPPPQGRYRQRASLIFHDPGTAAVIDTLVQIEHLEIHETPDTGRWAPIFARSTDWGFLEDGLIIADNGETSISILGSRGDLRVRFGRRYDTAPVAPADVEALIEWRLAGETSPARIERFGAAYRNLPAPETMPAFGRTDPSVREPAAVVVGGGRIWIKDFDAPPLDPPRWSVFSFDGDLVAVVELPDVFQLLDATEDAVVGLWRDALDIPHVRVYQLRL